MSKQQLVYSTDGGRHCPTCGAVIKQCQCRQAAAPISGDGIVRLQRQVKGRGGKPVVLITGLPLASADLKDLAKKLKNKCGVGGSIEDGVILIQGDKRELLMTELTALGYRVKISGG
jgi:translation initiation factor 1